MTGLRGNVTGIRGDVTGIRGDVSKISGDVTGIRGHVTGITCDLDSSYITDIERHTGIRIHDLVWTKPKKD